MDIPFDHDAIAKTASLLVGFSGGSDSTALLHLLHRRFPGQVRALHVHHGLQADADAWAAHCLNLASQLGLPCDVVRVDARSGIADHGVEGSARVARYAAFAAAMSDADILCTAHHQDDQAETLLLRLMRGSGVDGLSAMREWRTFGAHRHWRPLLHVPRADLETYCAAQGLIAIDDPSNASDSHERGFLRTRVLPLLRERWPQASRSLSHSAGLLARDADWLAEETERLLALCLGLGSDTLCADDLLALSEVQRAHVLRRWVVSNDAAALDSHALQAIERELLTAKPDAEASLRWRGHRILRWRDLLHIEAFREPCADWSLIWQPESPLSLPDGRLLHMTANGEKPSTLQVRARQGGERIVQPGRTHSQEVRKLFQERGIPSWERERLPMIWLDEELIAVGDVLRSASAETHGWWFRLSDA